MKLNLDEIEARANAATPGPFVADASSVISLDVNTAQKWGDLEGDGQGNRVRRVTRIAHLHDGEYIENPNAENDAEFFAHARQDVPALVARVRELEAAARWIPCEESLPELETDVLICTERGAVWLSWRLKSGFWVDNRLYFPTHWRSLPTPPEVKDAD